PIRYPGLASGPSSELDARNHLAQPPAPTAPGAREQLRGTVAAPLKKDKLFYFADYEGQRYAIGNPVQHNFPVTASIGNAKTSLIDACLAVAPASRAALSLELAGMNSSCAPLPGQPVNRIQGFLPVIPE